MPVKLSTTIKNIVSIPNPTNAILARDFSEYMKSVGLSEHFQNGNLEIVIYFAKHIGPDLDFTAKTMFLEEIRESFPEVATYVSGSTLSRKGLVKLLYELKKKIKFLLIDEVDKLNITDQKALYDIIESGRVTYHTGELNLDFKLENLKIIATSNRYKSSSHLCSRDLIFYIYLNTTTMNLGE